MCLPSHFLKGGYWIYSELSFVQEGNKAYNLIMLRIIFSLYNLHKPVFGAESN
jgi:hypothetical protein